MLVVNSVLPESEMPRYARELKSADRDASILDVASHQGSPEANMPAEAHLTQPFDADDLLRELERALAERDGR